MGEIFKLFGTIGLNNDEANEGIDETTGKAKKSSGKIAGFFKKAAAVIGGLFVAKKLIDFGALNVQAAANAQAMQAQFEQVFGELSGSGQKTIDDIAKKIGALPNRIKPGLTSMQLQFKGIGIDANKAMKMSESGILVAADAAAAMDIELEDATSSLLSFIRGNTEAGDAIGVTTTESEIGKFATEKLGIAWDDATEAQKQYARLEFAKNFQEQANVTGMAAEEADQYTNQLANMKQAWQDFIAIIGGPILAPVVAGLTKVSEWLVIAGEKVQVAQTWFGGFIEQIKQTEAWQMIQEAIQLVIDKFQDFINNFDTIKQNITNSAIWDTLKGYLQALVDFYTGIFSGEGNLGENFVRMFNLIKEIAMPILQDAISFAKEIISQLTAFWNQNGDQIISAVKNLATIVVNTFQFFLPVIRYLVESVWGNIKGVIQGALNIIMGALKIFSGIFTGDWSTMWAGVKQLLKGAVEFAWNLWNLIMMGKLLGGIKSFAKNGIASIKGFFKNIVNGAKTGLSSFSNAWNMAKNAVLRIINGLKSGATNSVNILKSTVTRVFNSIKSAITRPITAAKNVVKTMIDKIKGFFNFSWKLPKLKMPRFTVKGSANPINWLKEGVPKIGVEWFAKGGILEKATAFGTNGNNVMVGGEAGREAVLPLNKETLGGIGAGIAQASGFDLQEIKQMLHGILNEIRSLGDRPVVVNVTLDGKVIARGIRDPLDVENGRKVKFQERDLNL
ncbi:hypothetical protein SAMN04488100_10521 [Alkalibacterium putridalgicola]|uniref:Phage-related protein n=1 Tax=Alkalibacterium putridalgicola TaxID=426703 RepID=A0A1H7RJY1_9LACT|nr:hypothetical protein [Alkalibacterium putridalgicola]GEK88880.1 hypothetical protein APU01nite_09190 [Alkalibacterium putridalgicola]SEL60551.1 hypothetical protein SAMN04488100_10521 [Alkalibacterium putridalgicola]